MSAAAIIMHRQKQMVRRFRDAGVASPTSARSLTELGMRSNWIFRRTGRKGVFVSVQPARWYLDVEVLTELEQRQWRRFLIFIMICATALILLLLR
jgi:hypothetical protein